MKKYKGKHMRRVHPRYFTMLIIILLMTTISGTTAYLMKKDTISNEFELGNVNTQIIETFNSANKIKQDVSIKNSGNVPIFVRAAIIITWKDNNGKILEVQPEENIDYSISFSTSENWLKSDNGYYYYKKPIEVNENTDILIEECTQLREYDDKTLEVSIITQGIQAEPPKAVQEAWNVYIIGNCISLGGE